MSTTTSLSTSASGTLQAAPITCIQPGGGWLVQLELAWGRFRRWRLRTFWPSHVHRMTALRKGACPICPHDIIDSRDLKYFRNVCGYSFAMEDDPYAWRERLPIARPGWVEVIVCGGGLFLIALAAAWFSPLAAVVPLLLALFVIAFFRDPPRRIPTEPGLIVAPADGRVTDIELLDWHEDLAGPAVKIGIYLSIFNVHVNRCPSAARVVEVRYYPGQFLDVRHPAAPRINEQLWLVLESETDPQRRLLVKPIAGAFARRIVCLVRPGELLPRGAKTGMIKFGSRTELYLARHEGLEILVQPGQRVRGGMTALARER